MIDHTTWLQLDSNPQPLSSYTDTQTFSQSGQMIELCCEYLSVQCTWLYALIMSHMHFLSESTFYNCLNVKQLLWKIIWPVWLNGWVFICELSGCGLESSCSHLSMEFLDIQATIECGFTLKTHMWHDKNIQSNALERQVLTTHLNHLAFLAK